MITFKKFLLEAAVDDKNPQFNSHSAENIEALLQEHCSDALADLAKKVLWRGDYAFGDHEAFTVDPSKTKRKSQNTTNQYTEILDNNPKMAAYPKRSRSYIASTKGSVSSGFGSVYALIPYNDVKIGIVNETDLWAVKLDIGNFEPKINNVNYFWESQNLDSWKDFVKMGKEIADYTKKAAEFLHAMDEKFDLKDGEIDKIKQDFVKYIQEVYSPEQLGFSLVTTVTLDNSENSEVWIGGPCVAIRKDLFTQLLRSQHKAGKINVDSGEMLIDMYKNDIKSLKKHKEAFTKTAELAFFYANETDAPFPAGEKAIAKDPAYAFYYAKKILKARFPAAEKVLADDSYWNREYERFVKNL